MGETSIMPEFLLLNGQILRVRINRHGVRQSCSQSPLIYKPQARSAYPELRLA